MHQYEITIGVFIDSYTYGDVEHHKVRSNTFAGAVMEFRGKINVRRCSTGGRWGKSATVDCLDVSKLLASGYVWECYETVSIKRERIYNCDNH